MSPESANVYKAINELQTVLVGMIQESRSASHNEHVALITRVDRMDDRLRALEAAKVERTPWPPLRKEDIAKAEDAKPVFSLTWGAVKRYGIAGAAFVAMVQGAILAGDFVERVLHFFGFYRH